MIDTIYVCNINSNVDKSIDDIKQNDIDNGYDNIMCHFLIMLNGDIVQVNKIGTDIFNFGRTSYIVIRFVCPIDHDIVLYKTQLYPIYSIIYKIHKLNNYKNNIIRVLDGLIISKYFRSNIKMNLHFGHIDILLNMNKNAIDKYKEIKHKIKNIETIADDLIENNVYTSKKDIENSKYNKLYKLGIKRYKTIISKHMNNDNELVEVSLTNNFLEYKQLPKFIHNSNICITLYDYLNNLIIKNNLNKSFIFETIYRENSFYFNTRRENLIIKNDKYYIYIINLFRCWSIIKEIYPQSKTTNVIKKYKNQNVLNKTELKELLTAYILLSEEAKTIKDYDGDNVINEIYNIITSGTYIPTENFVYDDFQINIRNSLLYLFRDYPIII